jgi:uncharacterized damage-inducible protein DinB
MVDAIKLLEYSQELRHQYLDTLAALDWQDVVKNRDASFNSLRNIYLHGVMVLDWVVNHLIQGNPAFPRVNYDDFDTIDAVRAYVERVETTATANLQNITPEHLSRTVERKQRDGSTTTNTVEDYLIHLFQEETHHRGELIALLWQMDVSPPHMGWTQYVNK